MQPSQIDDRMTCHYMFFSSVFSVISGLWKSNNEGVLWEVSELRLKVPPIKRPCLVQRLQKQGMCTMEYSLLLHRLLSPVEPAELPGSSVNS